MTRDDIIRMAREHFADPDGSLVLLTPELTNFFHAAYAAGVAAEREACARVVEDVEPSLNPIINMANRLAAAVIRARGEKA